jgi:hypothetical protein
MLLIKKEVLDKILNEKAYNYLTDVLNNYIFIVDDY